MHDGHTHERRFGGGAERLRAAERVALLEVPRVVELTVGGLTLVSALDVGTGTGIFAEAFSASGLATSAVDANLFLLPLARHHLPKGALVQAVAERLPFADRSFDVVFLGHVLHETDDPGAALEEARRVARRRVAVLEWPYREEAQGPPLRHRLHPDEIAARATAAGFERVESMELSHMAYFRLAC